MSGKRKWLSLEQKIAVIDEHEKTKKSQRQLAKQFKVGKTQILNILRDKDEFCRLWRENICSSKSKKRLNTTAFDIDRTVYNWFCAMRNKNVPVTGPMLQEKALEVSRIKGNREFKASNGWLDKFRTRHDISAKADVSDDSADGPTETAESWKSKLALHCAGYSEENIFNVDDIGLFYSFCPGKPKRSDEKIYKKRITVVLCASMSGEFEKPLIIGRLLKPACFEGVKLERLEMEWKATRKARVNTEIMTEFLEKLNDKMRKTERKVLLFLSNGLPRPDLSLSNVKLEFFPSNASSVFQPLHLGIVKNFKELYEKQLLTHTLAQIDENRTVEESVTVLDAVRWTISAVNSIEPKTARKCFLKAGFPAYFMDVEAEEPSLEELTCEPQLEELDGLVKRLCPKMTGKEFLDFGVNLNTNCDEDAEDSDIQSIISALISNEERDGPRDEEKEKSISDWGGRKEHIKSLNEAINAVFQLINFCKIEEETDSLPLLYTIKRNFENSLILKNAFQVI